MKRSLVGISVFFGLCTALISQSSTEKASVFGTIYDPSGAVVSGVAMELKAASGGGVWKTTSASNGQYEFRNLGAGDFEMSAMAPGFMTASTKLRLGAGQRLRRDFTLTIGSTAESITVTEGGPRLKTESAGLSGSIVSMGALAGAPGGVHQIRPQIRDGRGRPGTPGTEEYGRWVENEFTTPARDPLSTFAVDVDTASYSNIRRFLRDGQLPPTDSVRLEELINYFRYDYPLPERGKPVAAVTHLIRSPWNPDRLLLHVGLRTPAIATENLPPSRLTFLIDVSGSMATPDKLPLVRQALQMLVRQLRPQDSVALTVYAGAAGVVLAHTPGNQQQRILEAIGRLEAGGSTHGSAGIRLAYDTARGAFAKNGNNRVILATDGDFNVGVQSDEELVRLIEQERRSGVFLSVLGFGTGNLKDAKMEKLADHGNGAYAYIDSLSEARKVFVQEMGASLVTVAKDVKLQIEFNPAHVKEYRLVGYENRLLRPEDFNDDSKDAGDMGAGHQVTAFYEIVPAGNFGGSVDPLRYQREQAAPNGSRSSELAWIKMRYKAPQADHSELMEWPVSTHVQELRDAPRDVRFAAAVAEYGLLLRRSKFAGQSSFPHVLQVAAESAGPDLDGYRTEFVDLVRRAAALAGSPTGNR